MMTQLKTKSKMKMKTKTKTKTRTRMKLQTMSKSDSISSRKSWTHRSTPTICVSQTTSVHKWTMHMAHEAGRTICEKGSQGITVVIFMLISHRCYIPKRLCFLQTPDGLSKRSHGSQKRLKIFGDAGVEAVLKELTQLHADRRVLKPKEASKLSNEERKESLQYLMFLEEKRNGSIKGRRCADGRKQRLHMTKEEASSPSVAIESVMLSCTVDAQERPMWVWWIFRELSCRPTWKALCI